MDRHSRAIESDDRGLSPVVGKTLAAGLAVLYIAGMATILFSGMLPDYRATAGEEVSERVLATATGNVERAVPSTEGEVESRTTVELPATIQNTAYRLVLSGRTLELDHPDGIGAKTRLSLPEHVTVQNGTWNSGSDLVILVSGSGDDRTLTIEEE